MAPKHIFITGGVVSSLGKGITAASIGRLMKDRGYRVCMQKFDPYINVNPGNLSPYQHGEVFVTDDGGECDLDVGHYERFIDESLSKESDITSGQIYQHVINKERSGDFHGGTVQVIPHITNEIKRRIYALEHKIPAPDIIITEIGGTVGDIEGLPFLEAIRQIRYEVGSACCLYIHVTLVPYLDKAGELKTKPTQHSVKELRSIGIQPDIIVCRSEMPLPRSVREKIGLFCNIDADSVISNIDAETLYEIPLLLEEGGLGELLCKKLLFENGHPDHREWEEIVRRVKNPVRQVEIALVGKYIELRDAYLSVSEALSHAAIFHGCEVDIRWVASHELYSYEDAQAALKGVSGIIVPSGFGERGAEGMVFAARYARENDIPFFAEGMGMQMAVVEYARNVCGLEADSTEITPTVKNPVIDLLAELKELDGDTMRLGKYSCRLKEDTKIRKIYGKEVIEERQRHRYELNPEYQSVLEQDGMTLSGIEEKHSLVDCIELPSHPWFIGVQFNAEFKSRPNRPHPLYVGFVEAALSKT
ncbi:MAG: CTP synthase [Firmicutes bacterium ADurb.Bin182]|nr:MAG: CTP synthase [Firmicutes bacterium ADurb.Bin182]